MVEFSINNFKDEDIKNLKKYLKKAVLGNIRLTIDEKIESFIEQIRHMYLDSGDTISFSITYYMIGNDILAALGASINERENFEYYDQKADKKG